MSCGSAVKSFKSLYNISYLRILFDLSGDFTGLYFYVIFIELKDMFYQEFVEDACSKVVMDPNDILEETRSKYGLTLLMECFITDVGLHV